MARMVKMATVHSDKFGGLAIKWAKMLAMFLGMAYIIARGISKETARMVNVEIPQLTCLRCGHKWVPRIPDPRICPKCGSYRWDTPRPKDSLATTASIK